MDCCPFTVLIDTNEKAPWHFQGMQMVLRSKMREVEVPTKEVRLPIDEGDYQVEGIPDVTIERKSLEDLYHALADRDAFREQCQHMNFISRAAFIIIEASWLEICAPHVHRQGWRSKLHPRSVFGTVNSWRLRFPRVHWIAAGSRRLAEITAFEILAKTWRHQCIITSKDSAPLAV
jgi:ERCC4-type nuclease